MLLLRWSPTWTAIVPSGRKVNRSAHVPDRALVRGERGELRQLQQDHFAAGNDRVLRRGIDGQAAEAIVAGQLTALVVRGRVVHVDVAGVLEVGVELDALQAPLAGAVAIELKHRRRQQHVVLDDPDPAILIGDPNPPARLDVHRDRTRQIAGHDGFGESGRQRGHDAAVFELLKLQPTTAACSARSANHQTVCRSPIHGCQLKLLAHPRPARK